MKNICIVVLLFINAFNVIGQNKSDAIVGKWMTVENNMMVEVYKKNNDYKAKIVWFKQSGDKSIYERLDEKNPDKALRSRKWIGMDVLSKLRYDANNNEWTDGVIYDAKHGKEWESMAWINKDNLLKVKGFWIVKFISETLTFKRV